MKALSTLAHVRVLLALTAGGLAGCLEVPPTPTREPLNLSEAKAAVRRYHDSGDYERELAMVANEAQTWIAARAARRSEHERLAVVLDIDETVLSNYPHMLAEDFGYHAEAWDAWVARAEAPALAPVWEVYATARRLGVEVLFITGRREPRDRAGTELNLRRQGMGEYARLVMAPEAGPRLTAAARKTEMRRALAAEGFVIIANIGDQESDLAGGFAERRFKLPDPFYRME